MAAPTFFRSVVLSLTRQHCKSAVQSCGELVGIGRGGGSLISKSAIASEYSRFARASSALLRPGSLQEVDLSQSLLSACAVASISGRPNVELAFCRGVHGDAGKAYDILEEVNALGLENLVPTSAKKESFVRQQWPQKLESGLNDMINVSYSISYVLHSLSSFCGRDYISLRGLARWYIDRSNKERADAIELSRYQSIRGGKTVLSPIAEPPTDFDDEEKGDALHTMEVVLAMYKVQEQKFRDLAQLADDEGDKEFSDFITENFLHRLTIIVKKTGSYVAQLRRVGKGHGAWHFDHYLHKKLEGEHVGDEVRTGLHEVEGEH